MRDPNKFVGCILGGAIGDALGYSVEFLSEREIFNKYGKDGISSYDTQGIISDDTQMTLFTAAGLLNAMTINLNTDHLKPLEEVIHMNYLNWFETQKDGKIGEGCTWLMNVEGLFINRAPGMTCLNSLKTGKMGTLENPINSSKGCGGVMRVAPIGLYFSDQGQNYRKVAHLGAKVAAITHGHPLGFLPSAALVHIIHKLSQDDTSILEAVRSSIDLIEDMYDFPEYVGEFNILMEKAITLAQSEINDIEAIHQLGEGWVAEEALAIAVYCSLKYSEDFEKGIIAAVNHKGDSDSTGSITGNILGAHLGFWKIPEKFLHNLELTDVMIELTQDLYMDVPFDKNSKEKDQVWIDKYMRYVR